MIRRRSRKRPLDPPGVRPRSRFRWLAAGRSAPRLCCIWSTVEPYRPSVSSGRPCDPKIASLFGSRRSTRKAPCAISVEARRWGDRAPVADNGRTSATRPNVPSDERMRRQAVTVPERGVDRRARLDRSRGGHRQGRPSSSGRFSKGRSGLAAADAICNRCPRRRLACGTG